MNSNHDDENTFHSVCMCVFWRWRSRSVYLGVSVSLTAKQGVILGLERNAAHKLCSINQLLRQDWHDPTKGIINARKVVMIEPLDFPGGPAAARNDVIYHLIGPMYEYIPTIFSSPHSP